MLEVTVCFKEILTCPLEMENTFMYSCPLRGVRHAFLSHYTVFREVCNNIVRRKKNLYITCFIHWVFIKFYFIHNAVRSCERGSG